METGNCRRRRQPKASTLGWGSPACATVAAAVAAERERCAKIAESYIVWHEIPEAPASIGFVSAKASGQVIAAKIREGK